ncbi:hypothetical protein ACTWQB_17085 [Piscibacillus sp. B03]|uniref:hypothetical protein n=1 Tax=Piscibacillus sp. B03 TaxID=3457430 RepID=UPI003FCD3BB7
MKNKKKGEKNMDNFFNHNPDLYTNIILKKFLSINENYGLLKEAINNPTYINRKKLDNAFKNHYYKIKLIKYINKLIYFYSID